MSYQVKDISQYYEIIKEKLVVGCPNFFFQKSKFAIFSKQFQWIFARFGNFLLYYNRYLTVRYQIYRNIVLYHNLHKMCDFFTK